MKQMNKVIIFDCDGTVINTYPLIMEAFKKTFKELLPNKVLTQDELNSFFGPSLTNTFSRYFKEESLNNVIEIYRNYSKELMPIMLHAFDNIINLLEALKNKGYHLAILSNKAYDMLLYGLELANMANYFEIIIGYEQMSIPKPNPSGLKVIKEYFGKDLKYYFVGDTLIDIETAKNEKDVTSIGVTWCITKKEDFVNYNTDFVVDNPLEILSIVED